MEEGEEVEITEPALEVVANRGVSFPLFASSTRLGDQAGQLITAERGSLRELVGADGGGIGTGVAELLALRSRLEQFDPHTCRRRAERCFTHLRMARDYLRMYVHLLEHGGLPAGRPPDAT